MAASANSSNLLSQLIREPRTRVAIATAAASAPLIWGGLIWVSTLSFLGQLIVGTAMGIASMASFHFLAVHRNQKRMHKAVTVAQLAAVDAPVLKRFLPVASLPSWIQHAANFDRVTWINRELEEVWPFLDQAACEMLRLQVQPVLDEYAFGPVSKINIKSITLGTVAPLLGGVKFTGVGKNEAMLEIEVDWRHGRDQKIVLDVKTTGPDFTVQVKDFVFYGILRVILKPLTDQIPCFGAAVVSLREPPTIDFSTKFLGGDLLQLPGVDSMIDEIIRSAVTDMLVWPSRIVVPILPGDYSFMEMKPVAYLEVKIIEAKHLLNKELLGKSDPFVYVYVRHKTELMQRTATKSNTSNPTWNEDFVVDVEDPETQKLSLRVMDSDKVNAADFLGFAEIPIKELEPNVAKDYWLKLIRDPAKSEGKDKDRGELHLVVTFKPFVNPDKSDGPKELLPAVPEGAGVAPPSEQKKAEGDVKKVSTPTPTQSGTAPPDARSADVHEGESNVTPGGLVQNRANISSTPESAPNKPETKTVPLSEPPAPTTPGRENNANMKPPGAEDQVGNGEEGRPGSVSLFVQSQKKDLQ